MSGNVVVLTPNGRRQSVKVTPNTTILQIIEEVCKKHGYKPEEYDIKHHKQVLDTTATFRFAGLPNNAQLELIVAQRSRQEGDVILGIHLEDGTRLMGNFQPSDSLWDVLLKLCPAESRAGCNPVIIYMRREVYGQSLRETTLKSLGLTGGRAMLRLIHRNPEELKIQANISAPLPSKPVEEKPYIRTFKPLDEPVASASHSHQHSPPRKQDSPPRRQDPPPKKQDSPPKRSPSPKSSSHIDEDNFKDRSPPKKITPPPKATDMLSLIRQERHKQKSEKGTSPEKSRVHVQESSHATQTKLKPAVVEEEFVFLGERNAMVFSLETSQAIPSEDLPDDFFDLTINDAKKLLKDIKRRRFDLENGKLLTSNLRNLEESKKQLRALNRYKRAIIRIQFPDRTVLQGTFTPTETIENVMNFIGEYLEDRSTDFYVYTTPPKTILNKESRLIELGCVPGALLYFGLNSNNKGNTFLRKDLLDKFTSSSLASLAANKVRQESINAKASLLEDDPMEIDEDVNVGASTSSAPTTSYEDYDQKQPSTNSSTASKMPKWFKPMK